MSQWIKACGIDDIQPNAGGCVKIGEHQIAIFNENRETWYAVQNMCPHKQQFVLSRGLIGKQGDIPKVACPLHKNTFSLQTGEHLGGNCAYHLRTYPIRVVDQEIQICLQDESPSSSATQTTQCETQHAQ